MDAREVAAYWEANAAVWAPHVRAGYDVYRDKHNTPAFLAFLSGVAGLSGLDIGCGEGANTRCVARLGAAMTGVDIAPTFLRYAREAEAAEPLGIAYVEADAAKLPFADGSFDFATAFMSLMDVSDQPGALREAHRVIRPGGFLQFSITHPCFVPPRRRTIRDASGTVTAVEVADYFSDAAGQIDTWWFSALPVAERASVAPFRIPRFHRTLSAWVAMSIGAGFAIEAMAEPCATEEEAAAEPVIADTRVTPLFLHVRLRKG